MKHWLDEIKWDSDGLVPAIAQDHKTGRVLMMAWMIREALSLTAAENRAIYWSRSRGKLWRKGGTPAMCDGVTQGEPGMELSLLSREVIARSGRWRAGFDAAQPC